MANQIRIKRSLTTAIPTSLANGELAYTANGDVLYIGSNDEVLAIGGKRTPGSWTANQSIIPDSGGFLDLGRFGNSTVNVVVNSTAFSLSNSSVTINFTKPSAAEALSGDYYLASDSTWKQVSGGGGASALSDLTDVDLESLGNNEILVYSNPDSMWKNKAVIGSSNQISINHTGTNVQISLVDDVYANTFTSSNGTSYIQHQHDALVISNGSSNTVLSFNVLSVADGFKIDANSGTGNVTIDAYMTIVNDITAATINGNNMSLVPSSGLSVDIGTLGLVITNTNDNANTIVLPGNVIAQSGGTGYIKLDSTGDTSNIGIIVVGSDGSNLTILSNTLETSGDYLVTANNGSGNLTINAAMTTTNDLTARDIVATGNLTVLGTATYINTTSLSVSDSLIELARNNTSNTIDIGFFGDYNNGTGRYTGFYWDASRNLYEVFANTTEAPTTTINTSATGYALATLRAYLTTDAFVANATHVAITANSTVNVSITANSLTLSTPLVGTSGGTGRASYTNQDLLVANTTNGFNLLGLGSDGTVLQSNGTSLVYSHLDGGTF